MVILLVGGTLNTVTTMVSKTLESAGRNIFVLEIIRYDDVI